MADATNALDTLGEILPSDPGRDAIHLATYAVTSDERLFPGQHIGFVGEKVSAKAEKLIGIVDPFLPAGAYPGQMFWMLLYPRTITSLRHSWTHPAFEAEPVVPLSIPAPSNDPKNASHSWIVDFADRSGISYRTLMDAAKQWIVTHDGNWSGEYLNLGGLLEGQVVPDEFWEHYEEVTGETVEEKKRGSFFTCSC
jgi:hypothetical protein